MTQAQNGKEIQNFPDGPVVKTQHIHCRGHEFDFRSGKFRLLQCSNPLTPPKKSKEIQKTVKLEVKEVTGSTSDSLSLCLWNIQSLGKKSELETWCWQ